MPLIIYRIIEGGNAREYAKSSGLRASTNFSLGKCRPVVPVGAGDNGAGLQLTLVIIEEEKQKKKAAGFRLIIDTDYDFSGN
jgi:hypothetical protein